MLLMTKGKKTQPPPPILVHSSIMSQKISGAVITRAQLIAVRVVVVGEGRYSDGTWRYSFLRLAYTY